MILNLKVFSVNYKVKGTLRTALKNPSTPSCPPPLNMGGKAPTHTVRPYFFCGQPPAACEPHSFIHRLYAMCRGVHVAHPPRILCIAGIHDEWHTVVIKSRVCRDGTPHLNPRRSANCERRPASFTSFMFHFMCHCTQGRGDGYGEDDAEAG